MRILALETSGAAGSVALLNGDQLIHEEVLDPVMRSARSLAPAIRQLLGGAGWSPRDVRLVAVTAGPGSFTGLRVGLTTAKTFAYATGAVLLGVDTLAALAEQTPTGTRQVKAVLDAQRQELFAATFSASTGPAELGRRFQGAGTHIIGIDAWMTSLTSDDTVIGPVLAKLQTRLPPHITLASEATWTPMAASVGRLAYCRYLLGERDDVFQLAPVYLRRSAAEEKADLMKPLGSGA